MFRTNLSTIMVIFVTERLLISWTNSVCFKPVTSFSFTNNIVSSFFKPALPAGQPIPWTWNKKDYRWTFLLKKEQKSPLQMLQHFVSVSLIDLQLSLTLADTYSYSAGNFCFNKGLCMIWNEGTLIINHVKRHAMAFAFILQTDMN